MSLVAYVPTAWNDYADSPDLQAVNLNHIELGIDAVTDELIAFEAWAAANYQPVSAELTAIASLSAAGYVKRTGAGAYSIVASIPQADVAGLTASLAGKEPTITTLSAAKGGTGQSVYVIGDILAANTTTTLSRVAGVATGNVLRSGGVGVVPAWGKVNFATDVSGTLQAAQFPALTGDVTTTAGSFATTVSKVSGLSGSLNALVGTGPTGVLFRAVAGVDYAAPSALGSYLPLAAGSGSPLSGQLYANGGVRAGNYLIMQDFVGFANTGAIYGTAAAPSSTNYLVAFASDASSVYFNATTTAAIDINGVDMVKATASSVEIGGMRMRTDPTLPTIYANIYGDGVASPNGTNWNLSFARNGSGAFLNGSGSVGLNVGNVSRVSATASGVALSGTTTLSALTGATTRLATISASGVVGAGTTYDGPWLPIGGGVVSGSTTFSAGISTASLGVSGTSQLAGTINTPGLTASQLVGTDASKNLVSVANNFLTPSNVSGTAGQVPVFSGANAVGGWPNMIATVDATNVNLNLGSNAGYASLRLSSTTAADAEIRFLSNAIHRARIRLRAGGARLMIGAQDAAGADVDTPIEVYNDAGGNINIGGNGRTVNLTSGSYFQVNGTDAITSNRQGRFTDASVTGMLLREGYGGTTAAAIYGSGVSPTAGNYSFWLTKDGASSYVNGSSASYLNVGNSPRVKATSSGVEFPTLTGGTTRLATISPSGVLGVSSAGAPSVITMTDNGRSFTGSFTESFFTTKNDSRLKIPANTLTVGDSYRFLCIGSIYLSAGTTQSLEFFIGPYDATGLPYYVNLGTDVEARAIWAAGTTISYRLEVDVICISVGSTGGFRILSKLVFGSDDGLKTAPKELILFLGVNTTVDRWFNFVGNAPGASSYNRMEVIPRVP